MPLSVVRSLQSLLSVCYLIVTSIVLSTANILLVELTPVSISMQIEKTELARLTYRKGVSRILTSPVRALF